MKKRENKYLSINSKKAISEIISIVMIIAITVALAALLLYIVKNMVEDRIKESSCTEVSGNVNLNNENTCYNGTSKTLKFSIELRDITIKKIIVAISDGENSQTFELKNESSTISNLKNSTRGDLVRLPDKKSGFVYFFNYSSSLAKSPNRIEIAPFINTKQCDISDYITEIRPC